MNIIVRRIFADLALSKRLMRAFEHEGRGMSRQALHAWKKSKTGVPPDRVMTVAAVMGLGPHDIRPDIFPPGTPSPRMKLPRDVLATPHSAAS